LGEAKKNWALKNASEKSLKGGLLAKEPGRCPPGGSAKGRGRSILAKKFALLASRETAATKYYKKE